MNQHLLRESPPGFGGVERVAHCLASELGGIVFSLRDTDFHYDPLPVNYRRSKLKSIIFGRFYFPLLSKSLFQVLFSSKPLIAHLPCPTVLIIALIARVIRPKRFICFYWHSFIQPRFTVIGLLETLYQFIALLCIRNFPVIVTSPVMSKILALKGFSYEKLTVLPCSLPQDIEYLYTTISQVRDNDNLSGTIIVICRLDSYKRVDWLIKVFSITLAAKRLIIVGDGPNRNNLECLAKSCIRNDQIVDFYGRVDEATKSTFLAQADLLVLPSDKSNEAFGIVQLEAMASGIPALAYDFKNSGMYWVSKLPSFDWSGKPEELSFFIQKLFTSKSLYSYACKEARARYENEFSILIWRERLSVLLENYPQLNNHVCN